MAFVSDEDVNLTINNHKLYTRVTIMTFNFITTDEVTGVVIGNPSFTNDSTSDIRRTMTIMLYPTDATFDVSVGGKVWMDKYVKVELGVKGNDEDDITYFNMGVFVIDNPSRVYSATENSLTLNCLDLMSRLTGIRGGVVEGVTHVIPQGSNVRETIIAILKEGRIFRYVVDECEIDVPYDINVDGGSSLYDLLKELINILPNYQIYFDVDGTFHYDLIPNGENEPIMANDDIFKDILINYNQEYDFENVKNCIEVIGGAHDNSAWNFTVNYQRDIQWDEIVTNPSYVISNVKLYVDTESMQDEKTNAFFTSLNGIDFLSYNNHTASPNFGYVCIEFPSLAEAVGVVSISSFQFLDNGGGVIGSIALSKNMLIDVTDIDSTYAYVKLNSIVTASGVSQTNKWNSCSYRAEYIGDYQPRAVIYEENPSSPFFDQINYHCVAAFNSNETESVGGVSMSVIRLFIDNEFVSANDSLRTMTFQYSLNSNSGAPLDTSTLHKNSNNMCRVHFYFKSGSRYIEQTSYRTYISADLLTQGTHICRYNYGGSQSQIVTQYSPNSLGTLRAVCSGDEYDNIWSDDLAMQRAKFELYQKCRLLDTVTINIIPQYWLDTNWLVEITLPNKNGIEETNQYLIKSISTEGGVDGTQSLRLMRYYPYYPSIN